MNKQRFINILKDSGTLAEEDLNTLDNFESKYPYSQILHTLSALGSRKFKKSDSQVRLTRAAVYATDRNVLKTLISAPTGNGGSTASATTAAAPKQKPLSKTSPKPAEKKPASSPAVAKKSVVQPTKQPKPATIVHEPTPHPGLLSESEADALRKELLKNLEDLLEIKNEFLHPDSPVKRTVKKTKSTAKSSKKTATKAKNSATSSTPKKAKSSTTGSVKQTKTVSKSSSSKPVRTTAAKSKASTKKGAKKSTDSKSQLKVTKSSFTESKPKAEKPKKKTAKLNKEQQELIDKFIQKEPSIKRKKGSEEADPADLAKSSTAFGENLVSENLAKVMVKQGKTNKAIDIYKKLIWKFPQKKAYFASQIESLKEK